MDYSLIPDTGRALGSYNAFVTDCIAFVYTVVPL